MSNEINSIEGLTNLLKEAKEFSEKVECFLQKKMPELSEAEGKLKAEEDEKKQVYKIANELAKKIKEIKDNNLFIQHMQFDVDSST